MELDLEYRQKYLIQIDEEQNVYQKQVKKLMKKFGSGYDKNEIMYIFEYCEYSSDLTDQILMYHKPHFIRQQIKTSLKDHKKGHHLMAQFVKEFEKTQFQKGKSPVKQLQQDQDDSLLLNEESNSETQNEKNLELENQKQQQQSRFLKMEDRILLKIMGFLQPHEIMRLGFTNKNLHLLSSHKILYKPIVLQLYPASQPFKSNETIFRQVYTYMSKCPWEYNPGRVLQMKNDPRSAIWNEGLERYKTKANYFKQFQDWFDIYRSCPRIRYLGYYIMKEKYLKLGERGINQQYNPIVEVSYYRYMRFLPDGRVRLLINSKKLSPEKLRVALSDSPNMHFEFGDKNEKVVISLGEFQQRQDEVVIKYLNIPTIFEYRMLLRQTELGKHDCMVVYSQSMRTINYNLDHKEQLYDSSQTEKVKIFKFRYDPIFQQDLPENSSLYLN